MSDRIDLRQLALFLVLAVGGAWLVASPLWLSGEGLAHPLTGILLIVMMFTPALAARITEWVFPSAASFLRLTTLRPRRHFSHWFRYGLLAWFGPILLVVAALAVAAAFGWYRPDLVEFSGFAAQLEAAGGGQSIPMPIGVLVGIQLATALVVPFVNAIPALGEELGWRGYLQVKLLPLGQWPAVLLTGVVWGVWHAPVILLGYNYPGQPPVLALGMMILFCMLLSVLLGWLTIASGTVWTAAIAHGFVNGTAGLVFLLAGTDPIDTGLVGLLGVSGWIVLAAVAVLLVALRRFPVPAATGSAATGPAAAGPGDARE